MRPIFFSLLFLSLPAAVTARADDLVTRDGTVYHDYKVLSHDAGYLTIMDSDGGGKIPLSNLPDDLQKQYGYNKAQADAFVQASVIQDRQDREAIAQEEQQHQQQMAARAQAETATVPAVAISPSTAPDAGAPATPAPDPPADAGAGVGATPASTPDSPASVSQDDVDAVHQKIKDLKDEIVSLKLGLAGVSPHESGAFTQKLIEDKNDLTDLQSKLKDMLHGLPRKHLTWDDVSAVHDQIVQLLDDSDTVRQEADNLRGATELGAQLRGQDQMDDDEEQVMELRLVLTRAIMPSSKLSPGEISELQQEMATCSEDINAADESAAQRSNLGASFGASSHQINADKEHLAELAEKLAAAGVR